MTPPAIPRERDRRRETIELPATDATQRALHEATAHLYDELARAQATSGSDTDAERPPPELFVELERLYVATAEESVSNVRISYDRADIE